MGLMVIAAYRPHPGKETQLLEAIQQRLPTLRRLGLATDRPGYLMRSANGTLLEVSEWKSQAAIDAAHANPVVLKMWKRFEQVCSYTKLNSVKECGDLFALFEPIER